MYSISNMSPAQPPGHGANHHHQQQGWSGLSSSYPRNCMGAYVQNNDDGRGVQIARARKIICQQIYDCLLPWCSHSYGMQANQVVEVANRLEETLFNNAASMEEYSNMDTLCSRIEVQLGNLARHEHQSLQCNGASVSVMEPTSNGLRLQSTPSSFGECNMSDIRNFPNQMISEYSVSAVHNQSDMIPSSLFFCNGTATTESETISELHAHQKPAQSQSIGGQNDLTMQGASFINGTYVSYSSRDQTSQFPNDSAISWLGNMDSNMVHANSPDVSETKFIQTAYNEPDQLVFDQHHQTGDRYEQCSTTPSILENHYGSKNSLVRVRSDCSSNAGMHMQCQSNSRSSLMPHYFRLPHPEEAVAIQPQVFDRLGNFSSSLPLSDTLGQLRGYDVHLSSQYQLQQNYAPGVLETTTSGNGHIKANKMSCRSYIEYPNQSEQHLANKNAPQMQVSDRNQLSQESESEYKYVDGGMHPKEAICGVHVAAEKLDTSYQPCLQVGSDHKFKNQDTIGLTKVSIVSNEESVASETASIEITGEPALSRDATWTSKDLNLKSNSMKKRQIFLLGLCHAHSCTLSTAEKCHFPNCIKYKRLLWHSACCKVVRCAIPICLSAKTMIVHFMQCKLLGCPLCIPVRRKIKELKDLPGTLSGLNRVQCDTKVMSTVVPCEDLQHPPKRVKTDVSEVCIPITEKPHVVVYTECTSHSAERPINLDDQRELSQLAKLELKKLTFQRDSNIDTWARDGTSVEALECIPQENVTHEELLQTATEHAALLADPVTESISHPKVDCVSLTELFTPEQVRKHIISLRQWVGQSKVNADQRQSMEQSTNQNSCQLCAAEELNFEPRPVYCAQCSSRIKRHAVYYTLGTGDTRYYFCTTCHTAIRGENSVICGVPFSKCELEKRINNEHIQEPWVQCDKCHGWQHQICALFNSRMNGEGQAKYTCPNCYVMEIERGERLALPQAEFLGAKDLPRTALGDHIERRLRRRLQDDMLQLAAARGPVDEKVPGGDLVVRVVLSVDKKLEVKKNFLQVFQGQNYPAEFPYKSKVILLFQNIEGVEVCLFGMYVQEYGSECDFPNGRRVYISYLDSVKYFRPDFKLMTGESLRTFVYHEFLIGYLEYCKTRGFTSCYIWVCPPPKGEDYILYCHPESQRTPKKDKLREWYMSMLKKAVKEDIVVEITNLYDHFLHSSCESKAKMTAARLPYFDGDYWPGIAEEKLQRFCEEGEKPPSKKSATKKSFTKRSRRTTLHSDISDSASKDMFLMHEIRKTMYPMKEDFIMVHLQHACTHCCMFVTSGNCWLCDKCSNFRLCDRCYEAEQCRNDCDRHPLKKSVKHMLHPVRIPNIPADTRDVDENIESEIFDTRYMFLNFSQGNHYQNDTLRRAKHSSMMLLYHLHNPTTPAFVTTCFVCLLDIEPGHGLLCEVCFEYEICNRCYEKHGNSNHPHKLTNHSSSTQSKEARASRASQVKKMNDLLLHVLDCHSPSCMYANCRKVKWLFHHVIHCAKRALKGCVSCKKMWYLLQLHSKACRELKCRVPRCSDLKMHKRRLQQQSESRCRGAVTEMRWQ